MVSSLPPIAGGGVAGPTVDLGSVFGDASQLFVLFKFFLKTFQAPSCRCIETARVLDSMKTFDWWEIILS